MTNPKHDDDGEHWSRTWMETYPESDYVPCVSYYLVDARSGKPISLTNYIKRWWPDEQP